jgi:hypothetical protein
MKSKDTEINVYMKDILQEMFRIVGAEYSDEFVKKENWFMEYEWDEKQQDEFANWLVNYLKGNREARKHFFGRSVLSNRVLKDSIAMFLFHCGWKFKEEIEDETA